jgi:glutamate carboxypeptidase
MSQLYDPVPVREFCRAEREWLLATIESLVQLESPSTDKTAVDRCGAELARRLEAIGAAVARVPGGERGDHLRAEFSNPEADGQVLLLGHFDTVWPVGQLERMPLKRENGRLYGPGVFDMKAGIAIGMLAARAVARLAAPHRRIVMLWTTDEEIGSGTSRELIEQEARGSTAVLVLEPSLPGGVLKTSRKGCGSYEIVVHGRSAHAGIEPQKGINALEELARQILRIQALQDLERGISVNVVQASGGARSNVIPDHAWARMDVRAPTMADAEWVDGALRALPRVNPWSRLEVTGGFDRPPLERSEAVVRLYERARQLAADMGLTLSEGATGGGSDGNFTAALGVPTLDGLGAAGDGAHALHEHVDIEPLADRAALVAGLLATL